MGTTHFRGNMVVAGTLSAGGTAVNVQDSLTITGATALNGGLTMDTNKFTVANDSGNTAIAGTLAVTGATTITGAVAMNGGITCDNDKFTVADTSGNTAIGGTLTVAGASTLTGAVTATAGVQSAAVAVTATVAGDGNGIIPAGTAYATLTSSVNTKLVTLPAPVVGNIIHLYMGANGAKLQSSTPASIAINGGTGAAASSAIGASVLVKCVCTSATTWVCNQFAADGTESKLGAAA